MIKVGFLLFVFCVVVSGAGLYSPTSNVIQLTPENFVSEVFESTGIWMVEFYAPWCGHCKSLAPAWEAAATNLKGIVNIAAVNCDEHRELAGMFDIKGFPTILFFGSEQTPNPHRPGLPWKNPQPYQGQRTASAIASYATSQLPDFVMKQNLDKFFGSKLDKVLLFSDKKKTTNVYKALALEFRDRLVFAQVQDSHELVQQYNIDSFPTLIVIQGENVNKFSGKFSRDNLFDFIEPFAPAKQNSQGGRSPPPPREPEVDVPAELITINTSNDFETHCLNKNGPSVIAVFDDEIEETEAYKTSLLAVAEKYKKNFRFLVVNGPEHSSFLQQLHIDSGYPQLIMLNPKKEAMATFVGSFDESGVSHFLDRVLLGSKRLFQRLDTLPTFE